MLAKTRQSDLFREKQQATYNKFSAMFRNIFQSRTEYEELDGITSVSRNVSLPPETSQSESDSGSVGMIVSLRRDFQVGTIREQFNIEEKRQFFVSFLFLILSFFASTISLALTHDRLPDRKIYKPLPDVFLDNVKSRDFLLNVTEIQILIATNLCIALILFHKHRFLIAKRSFFLLGILYLYRGVSYYVTVLPVSSETYYCSSQSNVTSAVDIIKRASALIEGLGLSINKKQIVCGDSIFSGHATILIFCALTISEYTPKSLKFLHFAARLNAATGILFLLISHAHYTIDVIVAYWITTRTFWTYHSLINTAGSNSRSHHSKEWWFFIFQYLEKHPNRLTNEFEIPWPLSLAIRNKFDYQ